MMIFQQQQKNSNICRVTKVIKESIMEAMEKRKQEKEAAKEAEKIKAE